MKVPQPFNIAPIQLGFSVSVQAFSDFAHNVPQRRGLESLSVENFRN